MEKTKTTKEVLHTKDGQELQSLRNAIAKYEFISSGQIPDFNKVKTVINNAKNIQS